MLSCVWLCDLMDCRLPGSSDCGILQARIPDWVAISFSILYALVMVITDCDSRIWCGCSSVHLHKHPGNPVQAHGICIWREVWGETHPEQSLGENVSNSDESPGWGQTIRSNLTSHPLGVDGLLVQFSCSVVFHSFQPHGLQYTRPPCPSPTPKACLSSCPLSRWCHPTISSSLIPFSSRLQSFPASGSFPMSRFFASGSQNIGASASACPFNEY